MQTSQHKNWIKRFIVRITQLWDSLSSPIVKRPPPESFQGRFDVHFCFVSTECAFFKCYPSIASNRIKWLVSPWTFLIRVAKTCLLVINKAHLLLGDKYLFINCLLILPSKISCLNIESKVVFRVTCGQTYDQYVVKVTWGKMSTFDKIYRSVVPIKFFSEGWGAPDTLIRWIFVYIYNHEIG